MSEEIQLLHIYFRLDCLDELPSDYSDSVCYKQWDETSCEKIASDPNQCDILWRDTTCSQHRGRVRDTCRKSCGNCNSFGLSGNLQTGRTGMVNSTKYLMW